MDQTEEEGKADMMVDQRNLLHMPFQTRSKQTDTNRHRLLYLKLSLKSLVSLCFQIQLFQVIFLLS
jgi:hypothetical protein